MSRCLYPSRRSMLKTTLALTAMTAINPLSSLLAKTTSHSYKIGACDWSIGNASNLNAMALAKEIGLDGVQVSLGNAENNMHLRQKSVQEDYLNAAKEHGVEIASLAIGELNNVPYKSEAITEEWVTDSIDVAKALGCQVILLAFFGKGDLKGDEAGKKEVIRRLKKVAPKAEKQDVFLAIESWLSADEHLEIIEAVGSSHVRVYYDVANSHKMGYDIYKEIQQLGTRYICEIHAKENGKLLGQGEVDFQRVRAVMEEIGYYGWVIMEGAVPPGEEMFPSYVSNLAYLHSVLNS